MKPKSKSINDIITDVTERHDDVVDIHKLVSDPDNVEIYGARDKEYFQDLCRQIDENGLIEPPIVYPETFEIKSGHTRIAALKELGCTEAPIIWSQASKPKNKFKNMMRLMTANMGRPSNLERQWKSVQLAINEYKDDNDGVCPPNIVKQICSAAQLSHTSAYANLKKLSDKTYDTPKGFDRPDLVARIFSDGGNNLSVNRAMIMARADAKQRANMSKYMHSSKVLENAIDDRHVEYSINRVSNLMTMFRDATFTDTEGETKYGFRNIQQNIVGGLVHELFANAFTDFINSKKSASDDKAVAYDPKDNGIYDISFPLHNAGIEIKTCQIKNGNKVEFISKFPKTGYFLFIGYTPEFDYFYVSYGKVNESDFGNRSRFGTKVDLGAVSKLTTFKGQLKPNDNNNGYIVTPHPLTF
jgi:hypothetical protein